MGVLTEIDRSAFAAYCQSYARWKEAQEHINSEGATYETENGMQRPKPWVAICNTEQRLMMQAASEFGLTPYTSLYGIHLYEELKDHVPVPVTVENDGKCGALAEVWKGNLSECRDGIVLILGTGVAGGIIKDRVVHRGADLSAGEFSFMLLGDHTAMDQTVLCKCSTSALLFEAMRRKGIDVRRSQHYWLYSNLMNTDQKLSEDDQNPAYSTGMTGYQFFALLEAGDPLIRRTV